jgi:hypothetical protein
MDTMTVHAEAETIWHLNFSDHPTEEFAGLRDVCEREQRREEFRRMLGEQYDFLRYHVAALSDQWLPLSALYGAANSGVKHGEYETLVWLGIAEHRVEPLYRDGITVGSRAFFRLAQPVREDPDSFMTYERTPVFKSRYKRGHKHAGDGYITCDNPDCCPAPKIPAREVERCATCGYLQSRCICPDKNVCEECRKALPYVCITRLCDSCLSKPEPKGGVR